MYSLFTNSPASTINRRPFSLLEVYLPTPISDYVFPSTTHSLIWRSRDVTVVRAVASHQSGSGYIPGVDVICELSLLLVLVPALRVFSGYSGFPSHKNQHFQIPNSHLFTYLSISQRSNERRVRSLRKNLQSKYTDKYGIVHF